MWVMGESDAVELEEGMPGRGDGLWWESEGEVMSEGGGRGVGKE